MVRLRALCEHASKCPAGVEETTADGADRHAEKLGDLVLRSIVHMSVINDLTVLQRQLSDRGVQSERADDSVRIVLSPEVRDAAADAKRSVG